jgi:hypothetical protein
MVALLGEEGPEAVVSRKKGGGGIVTKPTVAVLGKSGPEAVVPLKGGPSVTGKGSWFGQRGNWVDPGDVDKKGRSLGNAAQYGQDVPGIATPGRAGLGELYIVTDPSGKEHTVRKVDIGPGARTGRVIDINAPLAEKMGYTAEPPTNYKSISKTAFPTDAKFSYRRAPKGATPSYDEPKATPEVWSGDTSSMPKGEGALQSNRLVPEPWISAAGP